MGTAPHIIGWLEGPPKNRTNSQSFKVVCGHNASGRYVGSVPETEGGAHDLGDEERVKKFAVVPKIHEIRPGEGVGIGLAANRSGKSEQSILVRYQRVRTEEKAFHPAENGGVGANAQGQAKDSQDRKAGGFAKHAEREAEVLEEHLEEWQPARVAMLFFCLLRTAKTNQGLTPRLRGGHTLSKVFFGGELNVGRHFGFKIAVVLSATEERAQPMEQFTKPVAHFSLLLSCSEEILMCIDKVTRSAMPPWDPREARGARGYMPPRAPRS